MGVTAHSNVNYRCEDMEKMEVRFAKVQRLSV